MFAAPVKAKNVEYSHVDNNGHAMAPYMMSVGLFVACMAFTLMYPLMLWHSIRFQCSSNLFLHSEAVEDDRC